MSAKTRSSFVCLASYAQSFSGDFPAREFFNSHKAITLNPPHPPRFARLPDARAATAHVYSLVTTEDAFFLLPPIPNLI
jgi:hypothetical protein